MSVKEIILFAPRDARRPSLCRGTIALVTALITTLGAASDIGVNVTRGQEMTVSSPAGVTTDPAAEAGMAESAAVHVETAKESNIKAVYLYSFGRFTTWPGFTRTSPRRFNVGVVGVTGVGESLAKIAKRRTVQSRRIDVQVIAEATEVQPDDGLHMVFIAATVGEAETAALLKRLEDRSILTVTETHARPQGAVVNLVPEGAKIIFEIDSVEAKKKDLAMDARLLRQGKRMQPTVQ